MKPEQGGNLSISKEKTPKIEATPFVSTDTVMKAPPIMEKLAQGKKPEAEDVSNLVDSVAKDLKGQGMAISSDDLRKLKEQTMQSYSSFSSPSEFSPEKKLGREPLPDVDLKAYEGVIDSFVKNYGLDKGAWQTISNLLIVSNTTAQALTTANRIGVESAYGWENLQHKFGEASKELHLKRVTPEGFWQRLTQHHKAPYTKEQLTNTAKFVWEGAWPILLTPVKWAVDLTGRQVAGQLFMAERANLQEQVNNRIADSLYMRNFEFIHDQSSGEMLEILNRGKDATVDLVSAIYEDLLPKKTAQWGAVLSQAAVNFGQWYMGGKKDGLANALEATYIFAKKLVLDTRIKPNARRIQAQNAEALRQWDKVNTKLMTTLQGLETVRTAGNAEAGSDVLFESLVDRDFVEAGGLMEKRKQDKNMNMFLDILDTSIPTVITGASMVNLLKEGKIWDEEKKKSRWLSSEEMFGHLFGSIFRIGGSIQAQQELRQSFLELTHLYTDQIIPDLQDIQRMEDLLGPYDKLDHPMGLKEQARVPATSLKNFDIKVNNIQFKNILHNVSLDIPQGSFVTIKGPSGIGKSTLFRHMVGLYEAQPGAIQYGGTDINNIKKYGDTSIYSKIAYANQSPQFFEDMTLRENLLLWTKKDIPNDRIEKVLRDLNLDQIIDRLDTKSKHYSGGELRRIGIARALLKDPKVLFLDEPTANLDAVSTVQVLKIIQDLRKTRPDMTVVAITHDPVFEKIAEKIVDFEKINKPAELADNQVLTGSAKAK